MALRLPLPAASRGSARLRLTILYSGMFLLLGTLVVVIIFLFTSVGTVVHGSSVAVAKPGPSGGTVGPVGKLIVPDLGGQQHSIDQGRLLTASWLVLILTAIGSTVLGWFIAGRVLRPLRQMTETAHTISARNLGERLALSGPDDEFKRLGDTFDELLGRLQAAFEAQRRFVANAAHELRTPLTVDRSCCRWRWPTLTRAPRGSGRPARSCWLRGASRSGCSRRCSRLPPASGGWS
jgi:signal transduction histidine kinase